MSHFIIVLYNKARSTSITFYEEVDNATSIIKIGCFVRFEQYINHQILCQYIINPRRMRERGLQ